MTLTFKSIQSRLTTSFLVVALVPLILLLGIIYQQRVQAMKSEAFEKLTAIRDLKVDQLRSWVRDKKSDMKTISEDREIRRLEEFFLAGAGGAQARTNIKNHLERYLLNYQDYHELFIVHPETGIILISTDPGSDGSDKSDDPYFTGALRSKNFFVKSIYYSDSLLAPSMSFSIPIFSLQEQQKIVGVLVARVDLKKSLYAMLLNRIGMGATGETLIVGQDGLALNDLRWHENAPLRLKIGTLQATRASQGLSGVVESLDYRGKDVLAAYTFIERTQWGFVAKQDLDEVYAPIRAMLYQFLLLFGSAVIAVCFIAFIVGRVLAKPIVEMADAAEKIRSGDLSARVRIAMSDELGTLAQAFNNMAESVAAKIEEIRKGKELLQKERDSLDNLVQERTRDLQAEIHEREQAEQALFEANTIINRSTTVAFLWKNEEGWPVAFVSENVEKLTGYTAEEFVSGMVPYSEIMHPEDLDRVAAERAQCCKAGGPPTLKHAPYRILTKEQEIKWIEDTTFLRRDSHGAITHYEGVVSDITPRIEAEKALQKYHVDLEDLVEKRTAELMKKTENLEEVNTALKVLLRESGTLKEEIEENVQQNIKESVLPYLDEIKAMKNDPVLDFYVDTVKSNIEAITSSFSKSLQQNYQDLTPREIQVANCIRQGKTNKDIANLLNITSSAVDFHRRNLRIKLNLKGKKTNLRSRLLDFVG